MPETRTACLDDLIFKNVLGGACFGAKPQQCFLSSTPRLSEGRAGIKPIVFCFFVAVMRGGGKTINQEKANNFFLNYCVPCIPIGDKG